MLDNFYLIKSLFDFSRNHFKGSPVFRKTFKRLMIRRETVMGNNLRGNCERKLISN